MFLAIGLATLIVAGIGVGLTFSRLIEDPTARSAPRKIGIGYVITSILLISSVWQLKYPIRRVQLFPPQVNAILVPVGAVTMTPLCLAPITIVAAVWAFRILRRPDVQTFLEERRHYQADRIVW